MREAEMLPAVETWLREQGCVSLPETKLAWHLCDVVGVKFAERTGRRIPAIETVIAVELKVNDLAGVRRQTAANGPYAHYSWAALPAERVLRMAKRSLASFLSKGIGILAVDVAAGTVEMYQYTFSWTMTPEISDRRRRNFWRRVQAKGMNA